MVEFTSQRGLKRFLKQILFNSHMNLFYYRKMLSFMSLIIFFLKQSFGFDIREKIVRKSNISRKRSRILGRNLQNITL